MGIRYTKKTREILYFIEKYDFCTINIISKVFYKGHKQAYNESRVKLAALLNEGVLKRYMSSCGEYYYQIYSKNISDHKKYILDLYAYIFSEVDEVVYFKVEEQWQGRRSDAHIIIRNNKKNYSFLVEFEKFHMTSPQKYDELFESGEVKDWYKDHYGLDDYFPTVLIISPTGNTNCVDKDLKWRTVCVDYQFTYLNEIL